MVRGTFFVASHRNPSAPSADRVADEANPVARLPSRVPTLPLAWSASAALIILGGLVLADRVYFANGLAVAWQHEVGGETVVVGETVEHDISFPNRHRALARYVENWRVAEHGAPRQIPPLDAVVRARLLIVDGIARGVRVRSADTVRLLVDGEAVGDEGSTVPGWHDIEAHWTGHLDETTSFELTWENGEPIPRSLVHVPASLGGDWPATRVSWWLFGLLGALAFAALVFRARLADVGPLRHARTLGLCTLVVVAFGTGLRAYEYNLEPEPLENYDEYFNLWNGWSLLEDGTSRGWSAWPSVYGDAADAEHFNFWGTPLTVVSPYFENPPLMHLLVGAASHMSGTTDYRDARVADGRLVSLLLSALTIWLIILVSRKLAPSGPGPWLAGLLWAGIPTIVLQTRVIKEELLVIPLSLATILFFLRWRDEGRRDRDLVLASICAGLGVIAKIPAAILVPGLIMLIAATKDYRAARKAAGIATLGGIVMVATIVVLGADAFLAAQGAQASGRGVNFNLYSRYLDVFQVNGWFMGRGWLLFLWAATMGTLYTWSPQRRAVIAIPMMLYFTAIGVGAGNYTHGWLILPFVVYTVIGAGIFLGDLYRQPDLLRGAIFGLLFVSYTFNFVFSPSTLLSGSDAGLVRPVVMLTVVALTAPYCLVQVWPSLRPIARATFILSVVATFVLSSAVVMRWEDIGESYRNMDHGPPFYP